MKAELRREIEKQLDWLIEDGKKLVEETRIYAEVKDRKPKEVEEAQMRNLLEMATASDSIEALKLFVQYQMGRERLPRDFGEELIERIDKGLRNRAKEISKDSPEHEKEVLLSLVRHYLGYMSRYFKFKKEIPEGGGE